VRLVNVFLEVADASLHRRLISLQALRKRRNPLRDLPNTIMVLVEDFLRYFIDSRIDSLELLAEEVGPRLVILLQLQKLLGLRMHFNLQFTLRLNTVNLLLQL
jgi:hypothetical protein